MTRKPRPTTLLVWMLGLACIAGGTIAGQSAAPAGHVQLAPGEVKCMSAPAVRPKGVQIAVLVGNPFAEGFSIVRLKTPPHTTFAPHWHPTAENFTVPEGPLCVAVGDRVAKTRATATTRMGFASLPATHHHYAYTESEGAVIDLSFYGPFQVTYVNSADDPSKVQ